MIEQAWMPLTHILLGMFLLMTLLWIYQIITRNATIVDVGWTIGMGLSVVYLAWVSEGDLGRRILTATLLGLWSLRLGGYLFYSRILKGRGEDRRYARIRETISAHPHAGFFAIFQAQSFLVFLFMLPMVGVLASTLPLWTWHDILAIAIWFVAVAGESLSDFQLNRFKADPAHQGKTCQVGLWNYSRHPNYFFEWLHWFTYPLIALGSPYEAWSWALPLMMLVFLIKFTGIPFSEAQALRHRSDYAQYQRTTSMFIPWFKLK